MKRPTGMNIMRGMLLVSLTLLVHACGGDKSVASKSAAAYREAQAKGIPVGGGHEHGGHQAATATDEADPRAAHDRTGTVAADHSAHGTMSAADHATGHDMAGDAHAGHTSARGGGAMEHGGHGGATAVDHAAMGHGISAHAEQAPGHDTHGATTGAAAHDQHARMQHGTPAGAAGAHAQHRQPSPAPAHGQHGTVQPTGNALSVALKPPTSNAEMARTRPAATLQPDDFDVPVAIAVEEARKAAGGGGHEGHGTSPATADPHAEHDTTSGTSQQTVYTCPMHPEVMSATPGTCPKCGMTLVKKEK
jgi:hypothetical protein